MSKRAEIDLRDLVEECWSHFADAPHGLPIAAGAYPVLLFGNLGLYSASETRVMTVGHNPSRMEFPPPPRMYSRFPRVRLLDSFHDTGKISPGEYSEYVGALSSYFCGNPLWKWFTWNEGVLKGASASYRRGALHTDLCSPLATDPAWGKREMRRWRPYLSEFGLHCWRRLVAKLQPDIVLTALGSEYISLITERPLSAWKTIYATAKGRRVVATWWESPPLNRTLLVKGPFLGQPFGGLTLAERIKIGQAVRAEFCSA